MKEKSAAEKPTEEDPHSIEIKLAYVDHFYILYFDAIYPSYCYSKLSEI